jgi:hypothetical protein
MGNKQAVPGSARKRRPLRRQKSVDDFNYTLLHLGKGNKHLHKNMDKIKNLIFCVFLGLYKPLHSFKKTY